MKDYIDQVLGNNIRCLLPSYWWKRLFHKLYDHFDRLTTSLQTSISRLSQKIELMVGYVVVSNEETEGAIERNKAAYKKIRYATSPLYVSLDHSFRSRVDYVNGFYSEMVDGKYEDFVYLTGLYTYPVETGDYDRYRAIYIRKFKLYESGKLRGGNYYYEDSDLSEESGRAVQNMVVTAKFKEVEEGISSVAASIVQEIVDNECVTAAALNDLNDRIKKLEEQLNNAES